MATQQNTPAKANKRAYRPLFLDRTGDLRPSVERELTNISNAMWTVQQNIDALSATLTTLGTTVQAAIADSIEYNTWYSLNDAKFKEYIDITPGTARHGEVIARFGPNSIEVYGNLHYAPVVSPSNKTLFKLKKPLTGFTKVTKTYGKLDASTMGAGGNHLTNAFYDITAFPVGVQTFNTLVDGSGNVVVHEYFVFS